MRGRWVVVVGSLLFVVGALAAEPPPITPTADDAGVWRTQLVIPAPVEVVRAALGDPIEAARFSPDITTIKYLTRDKCPTLRVETGGALTPMAYDYRRCPTANGWRETLVSSSAFETLDVTWTFEPVEAGTKVSYEVHVETSFPAPEFLFARHMRSSITTLLGRLYRSVTGG